MHLDMTIIRVIDAAQYDVDGVIILRTSISYIILLRASLNCTGKRTGSWLYGFTF